MAITRIKKRVYTVDVSLEYDKAIGKRIRKVKRNISSFTETQKVERKFFELLTVDIPKDINLNFDYQFNEYLKHLELIIRRSSFLRKRSLYHTHIKDFFFL